MRPGNITRSQVKGFYNHYLDQSIDSVTFLWSQRENAVKQPHFCYEDIVALDHRIDALIRVLACSPDESWEICEKALELPQSDDMFVAAVLAYRSLDVRKIQIAVEAGLADKSCTRGLISAMAWLPGRLVHSWVKKFFTSKDLNHKYLAMAVCCARREDPREHLLNILQREDCTSHQTLHLQAIKLAGILKRFDVLPLVRQAQLSDDGSTRFWALWTQVLLGDKSQALDLASWITQPSELQHAAINMVMRVTPLIESRGWITTLSQNTQQLRQAIFAVTVLGDPQAIPWLIAQMQNPQCTRLAGEAFSTITGVNLEEQKLVLENIPDLDEILPDDIAENEYFEISEDQNLPFPDVPKIAAIWQKYQQRFKPGTRYFMGKQADDSQEYLLHLRNIYAQGNQRQRNAAAMELALKDVGHYWLNPKAGATWDE